MNDFVIMTDTGCDIAPEKLAEWGVKLFDLTFREAESEKVYTNKEMSIKDFYNAMRDGSVFKTSAGNLVEYKEAFEEEIKKGKDVVYISLSSGLSSSKNSAQLSLDEIEDKSHSVYVVDSFGASAGEGLLVYLAVKKREEGAAASETAEYIRGLVPHLCHWFTVDDLKYLKRGGRVSAASAFAATMLDIKPVLHMDEPGHLIPKMKVRGRKKSIKEIFKKFQELAEDPNGIYFISHGDCIDDAKKLEKMIVKEFENEASYIADIGPVIGAHSGPGTLALFFVGKHR